MERGRITGYAITVIVAVLLAVAVWMRSLPLAFGVLAVAIVASLFYSEWLKGRGGEVFSDERTLRIDEAASRRTLQAMVIVLAFVTLTLAVLSDTHPSLRSAYYLSSILMVLVAVLKVGLRHHYSRVM